MRALLAAAVGAFLFPAMADAQDFPSGPVTIVVPFAANGPTDKLGKLIAEAMTRDLGQEVRVENIAGAGGTKGAANVAGAAPDGNTILLYNIAMAAGVTLYRDLPYKPLEDFETIGLVADVPLALVGRSDLPPDGLPALIDYIKANKDALTYANAGIGSGSHLCGMLFMGAIDTHLKYVAFDGTGPAMEDLVAGKVDFLCDQTTNSTPNILAGKVKAYAVTSAERLPSLPDLPTAAEAGLPAFEFGIWHGLYAPKGTPAPVVERLSASLKAALKNEAVAARLAALGAKPVSQSEATPAALTAKLESEIARWKPLIEAAGVYAD
jgi:tripartite-type tricarboxylate transporter receptor subunit TctC